MSFAHPRRTTTKTTSSALTPPSSSNVSGRPQVNTNMSLRKGATFHSPPSSPKEDFKVPSLPQRSQTTLEDVVDAHRRRVALTLTDIDRSLAAIEESSPSNRQSFRDEADPIPQSFLNHTVNTPTTNPYGPIMDGVMDKAPASIGRHSLRPRHGGRVAPKCSDSGLGSSIGSSSAKQATEARPTSITEGSKNVGASAITRSAATMKSIESLHRLSAKASNHIREHVLRPLLTKSSLKDFHPIVKDCPRRIHGKEIVCLRDLEKTLIFMAPVSDLTDAAGGVTHWFSRLKERAKTAALYLDFCLTSIRCIQATVEFLSDRERTRPRDRPYTNGYFVDLVDQVKQYAQQVQAAKEKQAKGEVLDEMDPEQSDEVKLHGGLTKNGRPAELVRVKKNGKAVSISTGIPVELDDDSKSVKRSLSIEPDDAESVLRSMARRKRSATAAELAPKKCREPGCDKEFKRPCDLTKHEKTHSRPWKCPVETCKYHEYGWPTEKEMDRHHNDKHSSAPPLYECHFKPCPYRSKRESNCKQHMEKAHGWQYVRSKNNGKNREKGSEMNPNGLPTPQLTNIQTPSSDGNVVHTPSDDDMSYDSSAVYNPSLNFPEYRQNTELDFFAPQQLQIDFSPISDTHQSATSNHSPTYMPNTLPLQDQFQGSMQYQNLDWNMYENEDLYSANVQLPTPSHDVFHHIQQPFETSGVQLKADPMPHISPVGQGNTMLYTPTSLREVDEGFEDFIPNNTNVNTNSNGDFQLFPNSTGGNGTISSSAASGLFGEIPQNSCARYPQMPQPNAGFPGVSAQDLLDFYAASTAAAIRQNSWPIEDQFSGYRSQ